jgi:hypothetical protein
MIDHSRFVIVWDRMSGSIPHRRPPSFIAGPPKALFSLKAAPVFSPNNIWQPTRDGQRFLVLRPAETPSGKPITIFINWRAGGERRGINSQP